MKRDTRIGLGITASTLVIGAASLMDNSPSLADNPSQGPITNKVVVTKVMESVAEDHKEETDMFQIPCAEDERPILVRDPYDLLKNGVWYKCVHIDQIPAE